MVKGPFSSETVPQTVPRSFWISAKCWSEWQDLNLRPPRPERGALPDCATLRLEVRSLYRHPLHRIQAYCVTHWLPARKSLLRLRI